ncbi:MAG: hypothetical protein H6887_09620 [Hoeflea sp.]|nr:hypothetical protein [Hoeflea sp.]
MAKDNALLQLLSAETKADLMAAARSVTLTQSELVEVIMGVQMGLIPCQYARIIRDHLPQDITPTEKDFSALRAAKAGDSMGKLGNKIKQIMKQRRKTIAHIFWAPGTPYWAIISFDFLDIAKRENHWGEPHVHMISDLTHPEQHAFTKFISRLENDTPPNIPHRLHIRFERDSI